MPSTVWEHSKSLLWARKLALTRPWICRHLDIGPPQLQGCEHISVVYKLHSLERFCYSNLIWLRKPIWKIEESLYLDSGTVTMLEELVMERQKGTLRQDRQIPQSRRWGSLYFLLLVHPCHPWLSESRSDSLNSQGWESPRPSRAGPLMSLHSLPLFAGEDFTGPWVCKVCRVGTQTKHLLVTNHCFQIILWYTYNLTIY